MDSFDEMIIRNGDSEDDGNGNGNVDVNVDIDVDVDADTAQDEYIAKLRLPQSCDPPGPGNPPKELVWIVFGATGHMGRSLVRHALSRRDLVAAVGRAHESSPASMRGWHANCHGLLCDVRDAASVSRAVAAALARFGRLDVVANCSGYGVIGACEDQDEHEVRGQFETNFMGTLHVIQATLPYFRRRRRRRPGPGPAPGGRHAEGAAQAAACNGRYLIFSSTGGALGVPGLGPYCATKYAVEGLVEAMLYEIDAFGIRATLVEPGLVRRDEPLGDGVGGGGGGGGGWWAGTTAVATAAGSAAQPPPLPTWGHFRIRPASEAYSQATSPALHARRMLTWLGDRQPTSAVRCAELVWQLGHCSFPPLRLLLGSYAIESIRDRLRSITEELEDWKHLNFPTASGPGTEMGAGPPDAEPGGERGEEGDERDVREEEEMDEAEDVTEE